MAAMVGWWNEQLREDDGNAAVEGKGSQGDRKA